MAKSQGLTVYDSIKSIPEEKKYTVIMSNHVLEHVVNVVETIGELKKRLKRGGKIILILPLDDWREKNNRKWSADDPNHHLQTWTPLLIGNTLHEAGFKPLQCEVLTHAWSYKTLFLGKGLLQSVACYFLSMLKRRRQVLAIAVSE